MNDEGQRRLAANESVFRRVNEGIARGQWPGEEPESIGFRCECAQLGCNSLLGLSLREYERIRSNPRRFVMLSGHEQPEVETVVERHAGYIVVEKIGEAADAAERADPRAP